MEYKIPESIQIQKLRNKDHRHFVVIPFKAVLDKKVTPSARHKWLIGSTREEGGPLAVITYLENPCLNQSFEACKEYAELRLLPDCSLMPCILNTTQKLKLHDVRETSKTIRKLWRNFDKFCMVLKHE